MSRRALMVVALVATACEAPPPSSSSELALNGGIPAGEKFPAVGLLSSRHGDFFCTGTLIAPDVVLTAAHCVLRPMDAFYTGGGAPLPFGTWETPTNMVRHPVNGQAPLDEYVEGACPTSGDIGLVHLAEPITDIAPVDLRRTLDKPSSQRCVAIGFGLHRAPDDISVKQKRWGFVNLFESSGDSIRIERGDTPPVTSDGTVLVLPAGDDPNGFTDRGDSGGPVICDGQVLAVTACGTTGAIDGWYTLVARYDEWIGASMERWPRVLFPPSPPP